MGLCGKAISPAKRFLERVERVTERVTGEKVGRVILNFGDIGGAIAPKLLRNVADVGVEYRRSSKRLPPGKRGKRGGACCHMPRRYILWRMALVFDLMENLAESGAVDFNRRAFAIMKT